MSSYAEVVVLVEGQTEQRFVKKLLRPYLAERMVLLNAIILSKPGQKGGDVKFDRAKNDIEKHLKQRSDTYVTLLVDYYGIKSDWPGYTESKRQTTHTQKAAVMNAATAEEVQKLFPKRNPERRFIPYVSMHEIEALYFSDPDRLATTMGVDQQEIEAILNECGEPEKIDDGRETAPSKRLEDLSRRFKKTTTGIAVAEKIGVDKMREKCPLFNCWIKQLESLPTTEIG